MSEKRGKEAHKAEFYHKFQKVRHIPTGGIQCLDGDFIGKNKIGEEGPSENEWNTSRKKNLRNSDHRPYIARGTIEPDPHWFPNPAEPCLIESADYGDGNTPGPCRACGYCTYGVFVHE